MQSATKHPPKPMFHPKQFEKLFLWSGIGLLGGTIIILGFIISYNFAYSRRIYPNVMVDSVSFAGKTPQDVTEYFRQKNAPFEQAVFQLQWNDRIATVSGTELELGYDSALSAQQAYMVGRSGNVLADLKTKFLTKSVNLKPLFRYKTDILDQILANLAESIDIPPQDALFNFENGKVTAFKPSASGRKLDVEQTKKLFSDAAASLSDYPNVRVIELPVDIVQPEITTNRANAFGIKELVASGYSEFSGSIPGRIHNVTVATARFHGVLIPPGEDFSFNKILGDVSAATGYQQAYIIKNGRTVLGDGGGVCQVSTTLFRAALNAGLPILERNAHAYRVHYYEEGGFKAGIDATVFEPTVDLKFRNDTPGYLLIQTRIDLEVPSLTFELYGTKDGRVSVISEHQVWGITPPPEPLYQDDPTLPVGTTKQVDFAAWGAKASFKYQVTRGSEILQDTVFYSNYRPWQAVFLKGTKTDGV
jgi:vancomycin resistance protein YoaR